MEPLSAAAEPPPNKIRKIVVREKLEMIQGICRMQPKALK